MASTCPFYGCAAAGCQLNKETCEAGFDKAAGTCKFANNKCACPSTHEFATIGCHNGKQVEFRYPTMADCTKRGTTKLIFSMSQKEERCSPRESYSQPGNFSSRMLKSRNINICTGVKDFGKVEAQMWYASASQDANGNKCPTGKPDKIGYSEDRSTSAVCRCVEKRPACTTKMMGGVTCDGNGGYSFKTYAKDDTLCGKSLSTETKTGTPSAPFVVDELLDGKYPVTYKYGGGCYKLKDHAGKDAYYDISCKGITKDTIPSFKYQQGLTPSPGKCTKVHTSFKPASCVCMKADTKTVNKPTVKEDNAVTASVTLKGVTKADFDKTAQDNFKDVIATGAGKICGAKGASACAKKDVTIKILSRRAALKVSFTIKTTSKTAASTGATTLSNFLKGDGFTKKLVAKGGALKKVTGTTVDKPPAATTVQTFSGASMALPAAASALATAAALAFAFC